MPFFFSGLCQCRIFCLVNVLVFESITCLGRVGVSMDRAGDGFLGTVLSNPLMRCFTMVKKEMGMYLSGTSPWANNPVL